MVFMCKKSATTVSCVPEAVSVARGWARKEVNSVYAALGDVSYEIETVVSELVTNALQAGCRRLTLAVDAHHSYVRVAASDDASGDPVEKRPSPDMAHGRGLWIVGAYSRRWGVEREDQGKTVWAEIALADSPKPTFECQD
jgi:anti-sigma regulatory factor (Ser/Thr protein kinase)